jgi:tetratricopeptide (TPR) repeat protein
MDKDTFPAGTQSSVPVDTQISTIKLPATQKKLPGWLTPFTYSLGCVAVIGLAAVLSPSLGLGVTIGGFVAFVLAAAAVALMIMGDASARLKWGGAVVGLLLVGVIGLLASGAAYRFSVSQEENNHAYDAAVRDLQLLGDKPPYSTDLAQAYLNWGNQEINEHAYQSATEHLTYVVKNFPTLHQADEAENQLPNALFAWAQYANSQQDPITASQEYTALLTQYPSSTAAEQAHTTAPAAYLAAGDAYYQALYYQEAYNAYQMITKNFVKSPEAKQAHTQTAKVLWDWAQKLSAARIYDQAAQHYQDLVNNYVDTPQGQQAKALLGKGVSVIGRLFQTDGKTPVLTHTTVRLSSSYAVQNGFYSVSGRQYYADTDSNGYFEFPNVAPGRYLLEWRDTNGLFFTLIKGNSAIEVISVSPLQPVELAPITTQEK